MAKDTHYEKEVEFVSKEEAYWIDRKEVSENQVKAIEASLKETPLHIQFHKAIIGLCDIKIKELQAQHQDKQEQKATPSDV